MLRVPQLQVRRLAAADQRALSQVRGTVPDRAGGQGPSGPDVPARGLRLQAGGRDHRRMKAPVTAFLRHLEVEKHASPHTIGAYGRDLDQWRRFLVESERSATAAARADALIL